MSPIRSTPGAALAPSKQEVQGLHANGDVESVGGGDRPGELHLVAADRGEVAGDPVEVCCHLPAEGVSIERQHRLELDERSSPKRQ